MKVALLARPAHRLLELFGMDRSKAEPCAPSRGFHFKYDEAADLLFARCGAPEPCDNVTVDDDVVVRVSRATHAPVGIEVFGVSERFHKERSAINRGFARQLLEEYGPRAAEKVRRSSNR